MKQLLLLHGALGSKEQLEPLRNALDGFEIHHLNFYGHGGVPGEEAFSLDRFASQVLQYINENDLKKPDIFGYSMGGYVAMLLAKSAPQKINKIITLATKFSWDEATAENEVKLLDPEKILLKIPAFADELIKRHSLTVWKTVLQKTKEMILELGKNNPLQLADFGAIENEAMLLVGDKDTMISFDETIAVYRSLPTAQLGILPDTMHPIEKTDIGMLSYHIRKFLRN